MEFRHLIQKDENSISLKIESWCTPKTDCEINYAKHIRVMSKRIKQMTYNNMGKIKCDKYYIVDLDIRSSGVIYGKKSYMSCNIMLFNMAKDIEIDIDLYLSLFENIIKNDEYLEYTPQKKVAI